MGAIGARLSSDSFGLRDAQAHATTRDAASNDPRHGMLTPRQDSAQMPKAGQVNNHSSPALEENSGRPSDGSAASKQETSSAQRCR